MSLNNLKTRTRMFLGYGCIIFLLTVVSSLSWVSLAQINGNMDGSILESERLVFSKSFETSIDAMYLEMWALVFSKNPIEKQSHINEIDRRRTEYGEMLNVMISGAKSEQETEIYTKLKTALDASRETFNRSIDMTLLADYQDEEAMELFSSEGSVFLNSDIRPAINEMILFHQNKILEIDRNAESSYLFARIMLLAGFAVSLSVSLVFALSITRSIALPLSVIVAEAGLLANGDFSKDIPDSLRVRRDELGDVARAWDIMVKNTRNLLVSIKTEMSSLSADGTELASNMTETAASMNEINATMTSIKSQTVNQSASVTQTHATLEEIQDHLRHLDELIENQSANVVESSSSNEQMVANTKSVVSILQKNFQAMEELMTASEAGKEGIGEVAAYMSAIEKDSDGLVEAVEVIQGIAGQTNLLAMNAAIEAAHAGSAGKGFAVVADEIRKLAENSAEEGNKISTVLGSLKTRISTVALSSVKTQDQFVQILRLLDDVRNQEIVIKHAMEEQDIGSTQVLEAMKEINSITTNVKDGSKEMLRGSGEVLVEMNRLASITEEMSNGMSEMATGTDQINAAIQGINDISQHTKNSISRLTGAVGKFSI